MGAESTFDKRHEEIFNPRSFQTAKATAVTYGHAPARNTLTLAYHDFDDLIHSEFFRPSNLTLLLNDNYGQDLFMEYYKQKHGMPITNINLDANIIFVTWDMTQVNRQRRQWWRNQVI